MPAAARKKKRSGRAQAGLHGSYVVEITGWGWSLSFGINHSPHLGGGPYSDFRHLRLEGRLIIPTSIKASLVEVTLMPDLRMNAGPREGDFPQAIGSLELHNGRLKILSGMPADTLDAVLMLLSSGKLRTIAIHGTRLRYSHGLIRSFSTHESIPEDDLPSDW